MSTKPKSDKQKLATKFLEFQLKGLMAYGKYLNDQLKYASNSELRKSYKKYIENQILMNTKKVNKINQKLNK